MKKELQIFLVCGVIAALSGVAATYFDPTETKQVALEPVQEIKARITVDESKLSGRAAVIFDPRTGDLLYGKNPELQLPLASLTKIATALAVLSRNENQFVTITEADLLPEGDAGLRVGDVWPLKDLVAFGLTTSSNDAMAAASAATLSESQTVENMNAAAVTAGLAQSFFLNPTGLDLSESTAGAYGSALDVAKLTTLLLSTHADVFEATVHPPKTHGTSGEGAESTLEPIWDMPGLIAAKTGYTDLAGGNLAAVVDVGLNQPVVIVVLGSGRDERFLDLRLLVGAVHEARVRTQ